MADTSKKELSRRDRAYYRRRQQNRVFATLTQLFAEEAEKGTISKKELAEILGRDPSQVTRWLSAPSNLELDTISDMLLAMGAEMDPRVIRFSERLKPNYAHPWIAPYVNASDGFVVEVSVSAGAIRTKTATSSSTSSTIEFPTG